MTVVLIGLLFLYQSQREQDWQWIHQLWFRLSLLFVTYLMLFNVPLSIDSMASMGKALAFLRWPLFAAAIAYWLLADKRRLHRFLISLVIATVFVMFDTTWQYFMGIDLFGIPKHSVDRLTGPFRAPIPGTMMIRIIFILLLATLLLHQFKTVSKHIALFFLVLTISLLFVFITGERMAFLLLLLGTMIIFIASWLEWPSHHKLIMGSSLFTIITLCCVAVIFPDTAQRTIHSIFIKLSQFAQSDYGDVFLAGYQVWLSSPIVGVGYDQYQPACEHMQLSAICSHPHNLYLHLASETGLAGLGLFSAIIITLFYTVITPVKHNKQYLITGLAVATLSVSFWPLTGGINLLSNWTASLVWFGVGLSLLMTRLTLSKP